MYLTAHYTLTPAEALRGARAFKRPWYLASVGIGAILVLLGLSGALASAGQSGPGLFLAFHGALFALLPEAVLRLARRRRGARAFTPQEVVLDDEGLTLRTESTEGSLPWDAFSSVRRRGGFWIFRMGPSQAVLVPERALDTSARGELEAFLAQRKQAAP